MRIIFFTVFLTITQAVWAAVPVPYQGVVVLHSGQILTGQIYMPSFELIFMVSGEQRIALPVHLVRQVRFYDSGIDVNRKFEVLHYAEAGGSGLALFETVLAGQVKVLRKPRTSRLGISGGNHDEFDYYYVADRTIVSMSKFYHQLFPLLERELGGSIREFMRLHNLEASNTADAIQIIRFYNKRVGAHQVVAGLR